MLTYPFIVAIVSLAFGGVVLAQWATRRRPQQLVWGAALLLAAAASFAFVGVLVTDSTLLFRIYYAGGALLMAAYLGMGSLYLVLPRRVADLVLAALVVVSAVGVVLILVAPVDGAALRLLPRNGGAGANVLKPIKCCGGRRLCASPRPTSPSSWARPSSAGLARRRG
jgi:hypothetical protein